MPPLIANNNQWTLIDVTSKFLGFSLHLTALALCVYISNEITKISY